MGDIDKCLLRRRDKKYFSNEFFKSGRHHDVYKETISYYKLWDYEQLKLEKIHLETKLSAEQHFYEQFFIVICIAFFTWIFTIVSQYSSNLVKISTQATSLITPEEKDKIISYLVGLIQENVKYVEKVMLFSWLIFFSILAFLTYLLLRHVSRKQWYQKNLSVVNILLKETKKTQLKKRYK
ncbi:MAG: hypothetical protein K6U74_04260, partial [Firmicutes bacterium]|nr:hypothetical protein [Bacillota bacterium]